MGCVTKGVVLIGVIAILSACGGSEPQAKIELAKPRDFGILSEATTSHTPHYKITSTASDDQTAKVSAAVEALYKSYAEYFGSKDPAQRFELVLYKDQAQFRTYNRSSPWAEAYYRTPRSYAYVADGDNPYHWMIHEATHQLLREQSGYKPAKWINEGIASYFGSSKIAGPELQSGTPDPAAYPIWWLPSLRLSGNLQNDISSGKIIPLRQLITDSGPDINQNVNLYYMHYWSLTHFLFHYRNGHYSRQYKELAALGGSLDDFEKQLGAVDSIQSEWYSYLVQQVHIASSGGMQVGP